METPQNLKAKIEMMNEKLARLGSEKYVEIYDDDLSKTAQSLAEVSKYISEEFDKEKESIQMDVDQYVMMVEEEVNKFIEEKKKEITDWVNKQIAALEEIATNAIQAATDFLPKVSIPPTIQKSIEMIQKIKEEAEEKILTLTVMTELIKDNAMVGIIDKVEKAKNSFKKKSQN